MNVFLDALSLLSGGARTHLNALLTRPGVPPMTVLITRSQWDELNLDGVARPVFAPESTHGAVYREAWRTARLRKIVRQSAADVYFDPGGGAASVALPRVTMVRNMLPFDSRFKKWYGRLTYQGIRLATLKKRCLDAVDSAEGVIFISEWSRDQVSRSLGRVLPNVCVISHGVDRRTVQTRPLGSAPKLLYVSDISPYKRQEEVALAYDIARVRGCALGRLVVAGAFSHPSYTERLRGLLRHLRFGGDIEFTGWLGKESLARVVDDADILVFASSVECCPNIVLEYLSLGKPIVCSQEPPMPEFAGDGVIYIDPASPLSLADGLRQAAQMSEGDRKALAARAFACAQRYDWQETARQTWEFLRRVAGSRVQEVEAVDVWH